MCIVFFDYNGQELPGYKFILAATREEFLERATSQASWWEQKHENGEVQAKVLCGRDLERNVNGTWLGVSSTGRIAALTNYRRPNRKLDGKSRGLVTRDFLIGSTTVEEYIATMHRNGAEYDGYNLVVADLSKNSGNLNGTCGYVTNMENRGAEMLKAGTFGVTNKTLDDPWPKIVDGKATLKKILSTAENKSVDELIKDLIEMISNDTQCKEEDIPDTGMPKEFEWKASSIFMPPMDLHDHKYGNNDRPKL